MSKTEDIEAKLAAYIDGELDAAQRAEIEKHLAEHPKHRALIKELMGQRDLLKALPRQAAPADLAEAFTAQLERAVLLGDVDAQETRPPMRIGFFQQFRAVAAVLLLTCGLAAVIYQLLPRQHGGDSPLADLRITTMSPGVGVTLDTDPRSEPSTIIPPAIALAPTPIPEARVEADIFAPPASQPGAIVAAPIALADSTARDLSNEAATSLAERAMRNPDISFSNVGRGSDVVFRQMIEEQQLKLATPPVRQDQTVVVRADDMTRANGAIIRYLDTNNIRWEAQTEPMPEPLRPNEAETAMSSRLQVSDVAVKNPAPPVGAGAGAGRGARGGGNQQLALNNRIVARQVPRQQAQQVVSDMNLLQSQLSQAKEIEIPTTAPANNLALAPTFGTPAANAAESVPSADRSRAPATMPASPLRLLPVDPTAFYFLHREPLSISVPTTRPEPFTTPPVEDMVDVVILIEPQAAPAVVTPAPATQPAEPNPQ